MDKLLVRVDEDIAKEVRRLAKEKQGGRRGALSFVVEEALRGLVSPPAEITASSFLKVIDYVSRASKEGQPKDQILTNVFLTLNREFEQSTITGIENLRKGRVKKVSKREDPIEFLKELARRT